MHNYRGCYHFGSKDSLERALQAAREYLSDEELSEMDGDLFTMFRRHGSSLVINASLPSGADSYFVVAVLGALAWHATDGVVESYRGNQLIDRIVSSGEQARVALDWT